MISCQYITTFTRLLETLCMRRYRQLFLHEQVFIDKLQAVRLALDPGSDQIGAFI